MTTLSTESLQFFSKTWDVLLLFLIPIGGGIPAGVLLAQKHGLGVSVMTALYFISDIILAFLFEPILFILKKFKVFRRLQKAHQDRLKATGKAPNPKAKPFTLVMISFGVDPMTGRAAALAAGHGFVSGWVIAILGDMIFFSLIMVSTLWLNNILGDGTWTALSMTLIILCFPPMLKRLRAVSFFKMKRKTSTQ